MLVRDVESIAAARTGAVGHNGTPGLRMEEKGRLGIQSIEIGCQVDYAIVETRRHGLSAP